MNDDARLELFGTIAYAALAEVGHADIIMPAFIHDGVPYMQFDTDDYPEHSDEYRYLIQAEKLAQAAVADR